LATKISPRRLTHRRLTWAFAVWLGLVTGTRPRAHPALYLPGRSKTVARLASVAAPPCISGRTSYLRVRLAFHPYPQVLPQFCNTGGCAPRRGLTPASRCPWIAHPVSGRIGATARPFQTRFRSGSTALPRLNLPVPAWWVVSRQANLPAATIQDRLRRCTRRIILQKARRHPAPGRACARPGPPGSDCL
jgi:hypothetical protein